MREYTPLGQGFEGQIPGISLHFVIYKWGVVSKAPCTPVLGDSPPHPIPA